MRPESNVQPVLLPFYHRLKTAAALQSVLPGRLFSGVGGGWVGGQKNSHQSHKQPGGGVCDTLSSTMVQVMRTRWKMVQGIFFYHLSISPFRPSSLINGRRKNCGMVKSEASLFLGLCDAIIGVICSHAGKDNYC